jgi:Ran GTPase-activating protein (RanGAP) involved in mRNA processing and transport
MDYQSPRKKSLSFAKRIIPAVVSFLGSGSTTTTTTTTTTKSSSGSSDENNLHLLKSNHANKPRYENRRSIEETRTTTAPSTRARSSSIIAPSFTAPRSLVRSMSSAEIKPLGLSSSSSSSPPPKSPPPVKKGAGNNKPLLAAVLQHRHSLQLESTEQQPPQRPLFRSRSDRDQPVPLSSVYDPEPLLLPNCSYTYENYAWQHNARILGCLKHGLFRVYGETDPTFASSLLSARLVCRSWRLIILLPKVLITPSRISSRRLPFVVRRAQSARATGFSSSQINNLLASCLIQPSCSQVSKVSLRGNTALGKTALPLLLSALSKNKVITSLDISACQVRSSGAMLIAGFLRENSVIQVLVLSNNAIGDTGAIAIADALLTNFSLTELDLSVNEIDNAGAGCLFRAFRCNFFLVKMNLRHNRFLEIEELCMCLRTNRDTLQELDIAMNRLDHWSTCELAAALGVHRRIETLTISADFESTAAEVLYDALAGQFRQGEAYNNNNGSSSTRDSSFRTDPIEQEGHSDSDDSSLVDSVESRTSSRLAVPISLSSVQRNKAGRRRVSSSYSQTVTPLDSLMSSSSSSNSLDSTKSTVWSVSGSLSDDDDDDDAEDMTTKATQQTINVTSQFLSLDAELHKLNFSSCMHLHSLKSLTLYFCFGDLAPLGRLIDSCPTLTHLDVSYSHAGDSFLLSLCEWLPHNNSLRSLNLTSAYVSFEGCVALSRALERNVTLESLNMRNNAYVDDLSIVALSDGLARNLGLNRLDLSTVAMQDVGLSSLADALARNHVLEWLSLERNRIKDVASFCQQGLALNKGLKYLNLSKNMLTNKDAEELACAVLGNTTLSDLDLGHNSISDDGARALHFAYQSTNNALSDVRLIGNPIKHSAMAEWMRSFY